MRYCISNIDTRLTEQGIDFKDLPELFSIMISDFDIFKAGKTVYHIDRVLREKGSVENNGVHEIYVNAKGRDESEVTDLMKYVLDSSGYNPQFPRISKLPWYSDYMKTPVSVDDTGALFCQNIILRSILLH